MFEVLSRAHKAFYCFQVKVLDEVNLLVMYVHVFKGQVWGAGPHTASVSVSEKTCLSL